MHMHICQLIQVHDPCLRWWTIHNHFAAYVGGDHACTRGGFKSCMNMKWHPWQCVTIMEKLNVHIRIGKFKRFATSQKGVECHQFCHQCHQFLEGPKSTRMCPHISRQKIINNESKIKRTLSQRAAIKNTLNINISDLKFGFFLLVVVNKKTFEEIFHWKFYFAIYVRIYLWFNAPSPPHGPRKL